MPHINQEDIIAAPSGMRVEVWFFEDGVTLLSSQHLSL